MAPGAGIGKGSSRYLQILEARMAVSGEQNKYPEFAGNVLAVDTRGFWRSVEESPSCQGYHYNGNAETYMLVGDALGRGMVKLMAEKKHDLITHESRHEDNRNGQEQECGDGAACLFARDGAGVVLELELG